MLELSIDLNKLNNGLKSREEFEVSFNEQLKSPHIQSHIIYAGMNTLNEPCVLFECENQTVPFDFMMSVF